MLFSCYGIHTHQKRKKNFFQCLDLKSIIIQWIWEANFLGKISVQRKTEGKKNGIRECYKKLTINILGLVDISQGEKKKKIWVEEIAECHILYFFQSIDCKCLMTYGYPSKWFVKSKKKKNKSKSAVIMLSIVMQRCEKVISHTQNFYRQIHNLLDKLLWMNR